MPADLVLAERVAAAFAVVRGHARRDDERRLERAREERPRQAGAEVVVGVAAGAMHHDDDAGDRLVARVKREAAVDHRAARASAKRDPLGALGGCGGARSGSRALGGGALGGRGIWCEDGENTRGNQRSQAEGTTRHDWPPGGRRSEKYAMRLAGQSRSNQPSCGAEPFFALVRTRCGAKLRLRAQGGAGTARAAPHARIRQGASMAHAHDVCPWWLGYLLVSPLRRLIEPPERLLGPYVRPGMTVVEPGCGMGYFSLPIARLVGPGGRLVCVDQQQKMIAGLLRRARRAGLADRIVVSPCTPESLGLGALAGSADLAVAIHMVHEVPDAGRLLAELHAVLKPGGLLLIVEPPLHVTPPAFEETLATADAAGFERTDRWPRSRRPGAILRKPA